MEELRRNFAGSDARFAVSIGINAAVYSQIKKGKTDRVLSDANWVSLARRAGVSLNDEPILQTVKTPVFQFIGTQLDMCQKNGLSAMFCDNNDIGKSFAARYYAKTNTNAVYLDCSQLKSKRKFMRTIAREFGLNGNGRYDDVYEDLCFYLKTVENPLIILDEVADLPHDAFLEVKALWNATERHCGYYLMGAETLEEKISRGISLKKTGYAEIFSRFGKRYGKVVPLGKEDRIRFLMHNAAMIIDGNCGADVDKQKVLRGCIGEDGTPSLRRIYIEIKKYLNSK
jgi:DNA transposition AAA+ family ATPase